MHVQQAKLASPAIFFATNARRGTSAGGYLAASSAVILVES